MVEGAGGEHYWECGGFCQAVSGRTRTFWFRLDWICWRGISKSIEFFAVLNFTRTRYHLRCNIYNLPHSVSLQDDEQLISVGFENWKKCVEV